MRIDGKYSVTFRDGELAERHRFDTYDAAKAWLVQLLDHTTGVRGTT